MPEAVIHDVKVINIEPSYYGWGTVGRRRNGQLLVAASGGREAHVCPFGQVHLIRSDDGGGTWSGPQVVADTPLDDRDAGVIETRAGSLLVNWFTSLTWQNYLYRQETGQIDWLPLETQRAWRPVRQEIADTVRVRDWMGDWIIRSEDGGKTWSERIPTVVNSPHGPTELADGRLMYAGKLTAQPVAWIRGSPHESQGMGVSVSTDDGRSWKLVSEIPCAAGHQPSDYHEAHVAEAPGGRLVVQIRNHGTPWKGESIQTESDDGGKTWSVPHSIGVWGTPSHLLRLRDGRLLMTYGYRQAPFGNQARVSSDAGRTWSAPMTVSADGLDTDLGYPSSVELDDGRIVTVWYEHLKDNPKAVLRQARWTLRG